MNARASLSYYPNEFEYVLLVLCEQHDNTPMCHKSYQGSQVTDERYVTCYTLLLSQIQIKYDIANNSKYKHSFFKHKSDHSH